MATFATTLHGLHGSLLQSQFLGQDHHPTHHFPLKQTSTAHHRKPACPRAEFNILQIMGGRGLCNGEKGLEQELKKRQVVADQPQPPPPAAEEEEATASGGKEQEFTNGSVAVPKDAFEKEMMGLTGGFPGGEKGVIKFIEEGTVLTLSH